MNPFSKYEKAYSDILAARDNDYFIKDEYDELVDNFKSAINETVEYLKVNHKDLDFKIMIWVVNNEDIKSVYLYFQLLRKYLKLWI